MKKLMFCIVFGFLFNVQVASGGTEEELPDLDIELSTCTPDGAINEFKERWDSKTFWIKQNVKLETEMEEKWKYDGAYCKSIDDKGHDIVKAKCFLYIQNLFDSMVKCYKTSKILCRKNGGLC